MGDFEVKTRKNGFHLFFDKISYGIFCLETDYSKHTHFHKMTAGAFGHARNYGYTAPLLQTLSRGQQDRPISKMATKLKESKAW